MLTPCADPCSGRPPEEGNGPVGRASGHPPASVRDFIDDNRQKIDEDDSVWPPDDVRNYAYEGGGSSAGSLSSINSGAVVVEHWSVSAGYRAP